MTHISRQPLNPNSQGMLMGKAREGNANEHAAAARAKHGNDTDIERITDLISMSGGVSSELEKDSDVLKLGIEYLEVGDYYVDWFSEIDDAVGLIRGRVFINGIEKLKINVTKNGSDYHEFKGMELMTFDTTGPQLIEIDIEGDHKIKEGVVYLYRKDDYVPPVITPHPGGPVDPPEL